MKQEIDNRCDCGARITDCNNDGEMCTACHAEYWAKWCEECNADPDEPCAEDCPNNKETEANDYREVMYNVSFVGEFFNLMTCVYASSEDQAIENAMANLENTHGFNVRGEANEVTATREEK